MSAPIPDDISVTLPVGRIATAATVHGVEFQPVRAEWRAFIDDINGVALVTATVFGDRPSLNRSLSAKRDEIPEWVPGQPDWFVEQVARMDRVAKYDRQQSTRADFLSDMTQGLA